MVENKDKVKLLFLIGAIIIFLIGAMFLFRSDSTVTPNPPYYFTNVQMFENVTFELGFLTLEACDLNYTFGLLTNSSCGTSTNNPAGISENFTFINTIELEIGYLNYDTCQMNFTNGLLESEDCS